MLKSEGGWTDDEPVDTWPTTWIAAAVGGVVVLAMVAYTLLTRRAVESASQQRGATWKQAYHLANEISGGRHVEANQKRILDLLASASDPLLAASAIATFVRQGSPEAVGPLLVTVRRSAVVAVLEQRLHADDANLLIEALELVEVLQIYSLLGDAAALSRDENPLVVRAASDAVVALDPRVGLGILVARASVNESWMLDSVGRAIREIRLDGDEELPLAAHQWRHAPMLTTRVLQESALFDRSTVNDAITTLISCLDDPSSAMRLAAVKALAECLSNTAAQLALAGALGSEDRMTRYAAAAALADDVIGRRVLEQVAGDESDAARIATEILWSEVVDPDGADLVA